MRNALAPLAVIVVSLAAVSTRGDEKQEKEKGPGDPAKSASIWMKQKLAASQNILAGLTRADFDAIGTNAASMLAVGYLEKWIRADTPGYGVMMKDFEYANQSLVRAARAKNLDRATVAYLQLTLSCVNCHNLIRDAAK
jgi:hypothetical protein